MLHVPVGFPRWWVGPRLSTPSAVGVEQVGVLSAAG